MRFPHSLSLFHQGLIFRPFIGQEPSHDLLDCNVHQFICDLTLPSHNLHDDCGHPQLIPKIFDGKYSYLELSGELSIQKFLLASRLFFVLIYIRLRICSRVSHLFDDLWWLSRLHLTRQRPPIDLVDLHLLLLLYLK